MIPIRLTISGFLSYQQPIELDFTAFDLACIAGPNGAGKSSLLDAITWVLFGKARKVDDSIINSRSKAAEVSLIFAYEGNFYRVQRSKQKEKTTILEFQILQPAEVTNSPGNNSGLPAGTWKSLTEHSLRETDARIQETLRMDYETFVNASFFLQGRADQFTQQSRGDRKRILGSILGLEVWEGYRQQANLRRRRIEEEMAVIDGQLREIGAELSEEGVRKDRLKQLESDLQRASKERQSQETLLTNLRKLVDSLAEQQKWVDAQARHLEVNKRQLEEQGARLAARTEERDRYAGLLGRAAEVETAYQALLAVRADLERLDRVAERFREQERQRAEPRLEIQASRARLEQELSMLQLQRQEIAGLEAERISLQVQLDAAQGKKAGYENTLAGKAVLAESRQSLRERWQEFNLQISALIKQAAELRKRSDQLMQVEGALCPLCGQPLGPQERQALVESLQVQALESDQALVEARLTQEQVRLEGENINRQLDGLSNLEGELRAVQQEIGRLDSKLEAISGRRQAWESGGGPRTVELETMLIEERYALEARARLAAIDDELRAIGYDPQYHDEIRQDELDKRPAEDEVHALERARAAFEPLAREVGELESQVAGLAKEVERQQTECDGALAALAAAIADVPDLRENEQVLVSLQERENALRREVGAAHQLVAVLSTLKTRKHHLETERGEHARQSSLYAQLERAFSKDGVPALLIEQALPQIETRANEVLERLSGGRMSVSFATQAEYKDKRREDLKETLDIRIQDGAGTRDYELFSGGEAFRVNFAIRLALSEVLAQRAGARLQTLVIDEGFGSQDAEGRQRLIEAINLVRQDFAKILVITHIDELKDAFPTRIEVEKTPGGSVVRVIG